MFTYLLILLITLWYLIIRFLNCLCIYIINYCCTIYIKRKLESNHVSSIVFLTMFSSQKFFLLAWLVFFRTRRTYRQRTRKVYGRRISSRASKKLSLYIRHAADAKSSCPTKGRCTVSQAISWQISLPHFR